MIIRPATADDVPQVLPMVAKIAALHEELEPAKYSYLPNPQERYRNWLKTRASDARSVFLVAEREQENKLAGFLIGTVEREIPIYRLAEYGFIHDLWIEPEYRHEGHARQMTMLAIEKFRDLGMKQVRLDTAGRNEAARALFAACGFHIASMEMLIEL
jgi:ribosomal protein S18 acetylase RimI-like enzyme